MKRFLQTLFVIVLAICAVEISKALWSWRSALKEVDDLYVVSTNQSVVCLGASCTGCAIVGERFKCLWASSSFESISVRAPFARLKELERRGQLKGVDLCVMESCLFSYVSGDLNVGTVAMWLRELPANWRYRALCPVNSIVFLRFFADFLRSSFINQWKFRFVLCGREKVDRLPMLGRDEEWRQERIAFYGKRDFSGYREKSNAIHIRIQEWRQVNAYCREHGLKLLVMIPPMSSFYLQAAPEEAIARKDMLVSALKDDGVLVFDRLSAYPDELFFDPTHLTRKGAEAFTKDIESFIDANLKK